MDSQRQKILLPFFRNLFFSHAPRFNFKMSVLKKPAPALKLFCACSARRAVNTSMSFPYPTWKRRKKILDYVNILDPSVVKRKPVQLSLKFIWPACFCRFKILSLITKRCHMKHRLGKWHKVITHNTLSNIRSLITHNIFLDKLLQESI